MDCLSINNDVIKQLKPLFKFSFGLLMVLMATSFDAWGQVKSIGEVVSWKSGQTGIDGVSEGGFFKIEAISDHIIRVRVSRNDQFPEFSYVLDKEFRQQQPEFTVTEQGKLLRLQTSAIELELTQSPAFHIVFRNKQGEAINEDVAGEGFGINFIGERLNIYKKIQPGERYIGLGEVLGDLDKRGSGFTLNNTDTYRYGDPRLPMYTNVPFYIGIHNGLVYGLFFNNTYSSFFNFGLSTPDFMSITASGGEADYFFIYDKTVKKILEHYTLLTGRMPLPPLWSLGYHQSRCSYFPENTVRMLADQFRERRIPIDCIVLDADYLHEYEPFRINKQRFPDMKSLSAYLLSKNIEITASVNPGIKIDSSYEAWHDALKSNVLLKYADGSIFKSDIAPNTNNFVDFTLPEGRTWWAEKMKFLPDNGIHGYWNDMNEPAVGGSYLPDNLYFNFDGHHAGAMEAKNLYGMLMARSSFEAAQLHQPGKRPFVLSRSGFAGVQRYAAVWTGDNTANEDYLLSGTLLNAQMGLSGIPFVGDDIGGYIGETSKELFMRWIQVGVFQPFARNHKEAFSHANEPWSYGEEAEAIAKSAISFRYRLLPYLYTAFHEASKTGMPIVRSLAIDNPFDEKIYKKPYQYQFQLGDALMIIPVTPSESVKKLYLPEGEWYDLHTDARIMGPVEMQVETKRHQIPIYVKSSGMIPLQSLVQSTREQPSDTLMLHLFSGKDEYIYNYYEDDGSSLDYQKGRYCQRTFHYYPQMNELQISLQNGTYPSHFKYLKLIVHGLKPVNWTFTVNGREANSIVQPSPIFDRLAELQLIYDPAYLGSLRMNEFYPDQQIVTLPLVNQDIKIKWTEN